MNYFELLGLEPQFALDMAALETAYFQKQRQTHPDRFAGKPAAERLAAMQISADTNQAYETLKSPLKRAQYLLHLQGTQVGTEADSVRPSQALLVEVMEMREEGVEQARLQQMIEHSIQTISQQFLAKQWDAMAQETLRLGYLMSPRQVVG